MKKSVFLERFQELTTLSENLGMQEKVLTDTSIFLEKEYKKHVKIAESFISTSEEKGRAETTLKELYSRMVSALKNCNELDTSIEKCKEEIRILFREKNEEGIEDDL